MVDAHVRSRRSHSIADIAFLETFQTRTLAAAAFDHRAHLRLAWLTLREHPLGTAVALVSEGIESFANAAGAPGKFHATMTAAAVIIVAARIEQCAGETFDEFCRLHPDLLTDMAGLLRVHYSDELLGSEKARQKVLPADLAPMPPSGEGAKD